MNTGYLIYQAERIRSAAEQREVDATHAELAASLTRLWHSIAAPLRSRRGEPARSTAPDAELPDPIPPGLTATMEHRGRWGACRVSLLARASSPDHALAVPSRCSWPRS